MTTAAPSPPSGAPERVFDGHLLRARLWMPGPPALGLYVTFRQRIADSGQFSETGPVQHALDQGFAHLHLQTRWNDWYLNDETAALEAAMAPVRARFARAHALGFSMGGYAALRLSAALGLDRAIAVSPQYTLDPSVVPQDRRYSERHTFRAALGDLARHARPGLQGVVVFDPFRPLDRIHATLIRSHLPGMHLAPLTFGGHPATSALSAVGGFRQLQDITLHPAPSTRDVLRLHRQLREGSSRYWQNRATACHKQGRLQAAEAALRRSEALAPSDDRFAADD